jgi:hypothetical protein
MLSLNIYLTLTTGNWIAISAITVTAGLALLGTLGKLLYDQGALNSSVKAIDSSVKTIDGKVDKLADKFDNLLLGKFTQSKSPLQLNENGLKIFNEPEIKEFVKKYYDLFKNNLIALNPETAYQAQQKLLEVVDKLKFEPDCQKMIENFAFNSGLQVEILLKLIAIGIRDQILSEIGFSPDEIDKTEPHNTEK